MIQVISPSEILRGTFVHPRSAFLLAGLPSRPLIANIAGQNPSFVGFYGENSEAMHDAFDELVGDMGLDVLTTWHTNETKAELAHDFCSLYVPLNSESGWGYGIFEAGAELAELLTIEAGRFGSEP